MHGFREIREIREIRTNERITEEEERKKKELGYMKIKPETDITYEEANKFWDTLFSNMVND